MAEFVFKDLVNKRGLSGDFFVASSATSDEEIVGGVGNPIYPQAARELALRGIPFEFRRATRLQKSDYEKYEYFLCMDTYNLQNARAIFGGDPEGKCRLLKSFTKQGGEVADPWYSGDFSQTWEDLLSGCTAILEELK
jgi:protein-tyrosine phosphatase